jgi:hypothetical protein
LPAQRHERRHQFVVVLRERLDDPRSRARIVIGERQDDGSFQRRRNALESGAGNGLARESVLDDPQINAFLARKSVICVTVKPRFSAPTTDRAFAATALTSATTTFFSSNLSAI